MTSVSMPGPVSITEIADLLARARSLTEAGAAAHPTTRAAFLIAKAELLARIADQHAECGCHAEQVRRAAADARATAEHAAALLPTPPKETP